MLEQQQPPNEQPLNEPIKRESHQIKALLYKTASLQSKQICTNICQILTPIICLIFAILIRNVALDNLATNDNNVFNKFPLFRFKFNDFQFLNTLRYQVFFFDCNRWFLYDWKNEQDAQFIGIRNGNNGANSMGTGMLKNVLKTNDYQCWVNSSLTYPYRWTKKVTVPYFQNPKVSINEELFYRYMYFNAMSLKNIRDTNAVHKMPDGAAYFYEANNQSLIVDVKVNDQRSFQLHPTNALTRIGIKDPQKITDPDAYFMPYFTISEAMLNTIDSLTTSYIKQLTNKQIVSGYIYMPISGNTSQFIEMLINIICTILFPLSLSLGLPVMLYNLVLQKETKIVQMMRMNGMGMSSYWFVAVIFYSILTLLTFIVFYMFGYFVMQNSFFKNTSLLVFCVLMVGWILCQIGIAIFLQVFITSSRAANIIGYLTAIWTNLIGATLSVALYQFPVPMPLAVMLWPTIAFNRMFYLMFINCSADHCVSSLSHLSPEMTQCLTVIYLGAIFFFFLGIYLTQIIPQQFGVSKSILFPFYELRNLFKRKRNNEKKDDREIMVEQIMVENLQIELNSDERQDENKMCDNLAKRQKLRVDQNKFLDHALLCKNLTKVYPNGKQATTNFNLVIQNNQIFGLLGPNGAGKTTLISMLTGITPPTKGTGYIAGYSIQNQTSMVYMNMGVCPQFDILWDELTVQEHLFFYARLRGVSRQLEKQKVKQTIEEISLEKFAQFKVNQLSGGMKRRLSVAISLVGDPRVVFLDQPTTGLDPQNRRKLWELLSVCKKRRSLFLTTHMMEQAETLCDKVGIISGGYLRTVGTKTQLRKKYGKGYSLVVSVEEDRDKIRYHDQKIYQSNDRNQGENKNLNGLNSSEMSGDYSEEYSQRQSSYSAQPSRRSMMSSSPFYPPNMINQSIFTDPHYTHQEHTLLHIIKQRIMETFGQENCQLYKEFNNTLKFYLNTNLKMTFIIDKLIKIKSEQQLKQNEIPMIKRPHQSINFEWAIQHSSLEDVFFNVLQEFNQN